MFPTFHVCTAIIPVQRGREATEIYKRPLVVFSSSPVHLTRQACSNHFPHLHDSFHELFLRAHKHNLLRPVASKQLVVFTQAYQFLIHHKHTTFSSSPTHPSLTDENVLPKLRRKRRLICYPRHPREGLLPCCAHERRLTRTALLPNHAQQHRGVPCVASHDASAPCWLRDALLRPSTHRHRLLPKREAQAQAWSLKVEGLLGIPLASVDEHVR